MPPAHLTRAGVAPTPPTGPTTYAGLVSILVGLLIAILSLFDVVPTAEDVQQLGVIVGGLLALGSFVVTAISRTKQANNLAKLAQEERRNAADIAHDERLAERPTLADKIERVTVSTESRSVLDENVGEVVQLYEVGEPEDARLEVPGGGPRPEDLAPLADAAVAADEPGTSDDDGMRTEGTP